MVYLALGFRVMNLQAQSHWQHADLTAITEGPGTLNPIAMAFDPVWQGTRTHYVDDYRHVHELFLSGTHWQDADLTAIAKGADLDGELAMAFDPVWQGMRTHYIGSDWHVHELFVSGETPSPSEKTATITIFLQRQQVYSGPIPYAAQFPAFGSIYNGKLKSIKNLSNAFNPLGLSLVKGRYSTADCGNANAVVFLGPEQSTTPNDIKAIYGSATPTLPVNIVACLITNRPVPDSVAVDVTYTYTQ